MVAGRIYIHKNKINGKCYVGSTIQPVKRRWRKSKTSYISYKNSKIFYKALCKYGWDAFYSSIIFEVFNQKDIPFYEQYFITLFNSLAPNGYNSAYFIGERVVYSDETRQKISVARKKYFKSLKTPITPPNKIEHVIIDEIDHKKCTKCVATLPLSHFNKNKRNWDGLTHWCKKCIKTHSYKNRYVKISKEQFEQSYQDRSKKIKNSISTFYKNNPEIKKHLSKIKSKAITAIDLETGAKFEFNSALDAKKVGFGDNTNIGQAVKYRRPYKNKIFYFSKEKGKKLSPGELLPSEKIDVMDSIYASRALLNSNKIPHKIFARKCIIKEVPLEIERDFLNENHLQGYVRSKICYGLFYNDQLVSLMSFDSPRFGKKYDWELIRFVSKKNHLIVGAASKLFAFFIKQQSPKSVLSYADMRYSEGNIYKILGFALQGKTKNTYWYVRGDEVLPRLKCQKKILSKKMQYYFDHLTEEENMIINGYTKIEGPGHLVFVWTAI